MIDTPSDPCVFCQIIDGEAPATVHKWTPSTMIIEPLKPVTPGHVIAMPLVHVTDAYENPTITGQVMLEASLWACIRASHDSRYESANLITSIGRPATQSVFHLHIHIVPRAINDGLALPWYSGKGGHQC